MKIRAPVYECEYPVSPATRSGDILDIITDLFYIGDF